LGTEQVKHWEKIGGRKVAAIRIPDRWLQGRSLMHELSGLDSRAAVEQAVRDWLEQERLEAEFKAQRVVEVEPLNRVNVTGMQADRLILKAAIPDVVADLPHNWTATQIEVNLALLRMGRSNKAKRSAIAVLERKLCASSPEGNVLETSTE